MSLEANKIAGAILLAGVLTMGAGYVGDIMVPDKSKHHGDDHHNEVAYPIVMPEGSAEDVAMVEEEPEVVAEVLPLLASADIGAGESAFKRRCASCHSINEGGAHKTGPALWGVVGRPIAAAAGYTKYKGLENVEAEQWSYEALNGFIHNPKGWAPGTAMNFRGLSDVQDRADIIAYLRAQASVPLALDAFAE